ncbi:hypothetical protein UFOVP695_6 [uncultured Caudovirales phage]|uniref:Uncharacterized protein n=1 Tax=uncultured Caudovirales phage TaxID=2100421 RepID=A0A6J5NSG3_9CAUD|nr:hypothetical protein UFOVP695_6 [uncultured Caudovirales phage]
MYYQEILHINKSYIYSIVKNYEIIKDSDEYNEFQNSEDPTILGFTFEREYINNYE